MEEREEYTKREWQKPKYKSLKFSQTYGGWLGPVPEATNSSTGGSS